MPMRYTVLSLILSKRIFCIKTCDLKGGIEVIANLCWGFHEFVPTFLYYLSIKGSFLVLLSVFSFFLGLWTWSVL